jgi:hypothetical protein
MLADENKIKAIASPINRFITHSVSAPARGKLFRFCSAARGQIKLTLTWIERGARRVAAKKQILI